MDVSCSAAIWSDLAHLIPSLSFVSPFQVMDSKYRPCLTERELANNLQAIVADADKTPPNQVAQGAIGVLSSEARRVWAGLRQILASNSNNKMCLDIVDSALFVVCLDDTSPENADDMCSNMLCGTYKLEKGVSSFRPT